jgi:hypothetical protein
MVTALQVMYKPGMVWPVLLLYLLQYKSATQQVLHSIPTAGLPKIPALNTNKTLIAVRLLNAILQL